MSNLHVAVVSHSMIAATDANPSGLITDVSVAVADAPRAGREVVVAGLALVTASSEHTWQAGTLAADSITEFVPWTLGVAVASWMQIIRFRFCWF